MDEPRAQHILGGSDPPSASTATWPRPPVSVVILTQDEQVNIGPCLDSCGWSDDVHVLDSGSTDRTVAIAESMGAKVHHHPFESFGAQRNWAIDNIPLRHDWVFHLDADERFTRPLVEEMQRRLAASPSEAGFYVPSKLILLGRWLRRCGGYPTYQMRLFHKRRMRFIDYGHGQREKTDGKVGRLDEPYLHHNFSKGLDDWFARHNRYSALEAREMLRESGTALRLRDLLGSDPVARRRALKRLWYRMPMRPFLRLFLTLFVNGGILEGRQGLLYASLLAAYERMTVLKAEALRLERRSTDASPAGAG